MLNIFDGIARRTISSDYRPYINHRALKQCPRWQPSSTHIFFPPASPSDIVHLDTVYFAGQHRPITARTPPRALKQFTLCLSQTSRQRGRRQSPLSRQKYNTSRRRAFANVAISGDRRSARDYCPVTTVRRLRHRGTYASLLLLSPAIRTKQPLTCSLGYWSPSCRRAPHHALLPPRGRLSAAQFRLGLRHRPQSPAPSLPLRPFSRSRSSYRSRQRRPTAPAATASGRRARRSGPRIARTPRSTA